MSSKTFFNTLFCLSRNHCRQNSSKLRRGLCLFYDGWIFWALLSTSSRLSFFCRRPWSGLPLGSISLALATCPGQGFIRSETKTPELVVNEGSRESFLKVLASVTSPNALPSKVLSCTGPSVPRPSNLLSNEPRVQSIIARIANIVVVPRCLGQQATLYCDALPTISSCSGQRWPSTCGRTAALQESELPWLRQTLCNIILLWHISNIW